MSLIDTRTPEEFYANLLAPLKRRNLAGRLHYFARDRERTRESYWQTISTRTGGLGAVPPTCDAAGLLDQLAEYWERRGAESQPLTRLLPHLKRLQAALAEEGTKVSSAGDSEVPDFVYVLF
jgi:hypothetical protein